MTQEEIKLLLVDLCARLPYGVKIKLGNNPEIITLTTIDMINGNVNNFFAQPYPYLRPMTSMTIDERFVYNGLCNEVADFDWEIISHKIYDWLNEHHFDYRGLIEKGLALEAPKGMYEK